MDSIEFTNAVYMNYSARVMSGQIPKEVEGTVLGFFSNGYHRAYVGHSSVGHQLPITPYDGDSNQKVDRLLENQRVVGIAVLDRAILEHLKRTGKFEVEKGNPIRYNRAGRTFHVF